MSKLNTNNFFKRNFKIILKTFAGIFILACVGIGIFVIDFMDGVLHLQKTTKKCGEYTFYNYPTIKGTIFIHPKHQSGNEGEYIGEYSTDKSIETPKTIYLNDSTLKNDPKIIEAVRECYPDFYISYNSVKKE